MGLTEKEMVVMHYGRAVTNQMIVTERVVANHVCLLHLPLIVLHATIFLPHPLLRRIKHALTFQIFLQKSVTRMMLGKRRDIVNLAASRKGLDMKILSVVTSLLLIESN